jgi:RNA-directed DNA polymerase
MPANAVRGTSIVKRIGFLYEQISQYENLLDAFHAAARRKRQRPEVRAFSESLPRQLTRMQDGFRHESLELGDYHYFTIYDPKQRRICAASFPERVIHHAVVNVAGTVLLRPLIDQTYACRVGKGQHRAVGLARRYAEDFPFFLKMDVRKYYDSIEHARVAQQLARILKDPPLLRWFDRLLDTYHTQPGRGLPIGNLTSQYLANLFLSPLDHFVQHQLGCRAYIRYMDDFVLWGTRQQVRQWRPAASGFLAERLRLQTKGGGFINRSTHGCEFLGYRVFPDRLALSRQAARRLRAKTRALEYAFARGELTEDELQRRVTAVFSFAAAADSRTLRRGVVAGTLLQAY